MKDPIKEEIERIEWQIDQTRILVDPWLYVIVDSKCAIRWIVGKDVLSIILDIFYL